MTLNQPVVSVTVYRIGDVMVCNAVSSLDGVEFDLAEGEGTVDLILDPLMPGPGEYTVAVGIYPVLDLSESAALQLAVLWHEPRTFAVCQPQGMAVDLGVVRHPARWQVAGPQGVEAPAVFRRNSP
ncbi:MAG: hypothetical protein ACRDGM_20345 [bacterium]